MSTPGEQLAEAAASFLGTRFRLLGRDPATGLDCIGLVDASLRAIGRDPVSPRGYRLRNSDVGRWMVCAPLSGFKNVLSEREPGDLVLYSPGPVQHHLAIVESDGLFIHAHAGLRRVVRQSLCLPDPFLAHWRLSPSFEGNA